MTGWKRKTWPVSRLGTGLITLMIMGSTNAAEPGSQQPTLEMLEFLLEWESTDGQWLDPAESDPDVWQVNDAETDVATDTEAGS